MPGYRGHRRRVEAAVGALKNMRVAGVGPLKRGKALSIVYTGV